MDINNLWSGIDLKTYKQNTRCLAINTILAGKYLVGPVLGQGGFGITYLGYDLNMETRIAIKEYFPVELVSRDTTTMHGDKVLSLSGEKSVTYQQGLKKYVAEAQNVSQFSETPGVVSVKDFFYENETAYIVMEYIDGISLKDYLKEKGGRLSEEETLRIMKPVLEALVKVHEAGIIHRDISPDNIMLTFEDSAAGAGNVGQTDVTSGSRVSGQASHGKETGQVSDRSIKSVKLIDFGAARMTAKNDQKSLTIILKHGYAPEEQYRTHGEQGSWTDVYAVCAVLYRMLTGETPVPAMDRIFKDELKGFEELNVNISANTSAAILKGLAVKKDDRIQNVQELIDVLYKGTKVKATDKKNRQILYLAVGIAAVLLVSVVGLTLSGILKGTNVSENAESLTAGMYNASDNAGVLVNGDVSGQEGIGQENAGDETMVLDDRNQEEAGEQIVFYHPQRSNARSSAHMLICLPDGTVKAYGSNSVGQCDVEEWTDVVRVEAGQNISLGVCKDGSVLFAGSNYRLSYIEQWKDILDVQLSTVGIIGLKKDGSMIISGNDTEEEKELNLVKEIEQWTDMKAIETGYSYIFGLKNDGTVVGVDTKGSKYSITGWENAECIEVIANRRGMVLCGICEDGSLLTYDLESYVSDSSAGKLIDSVLQGEKVSQIIGDAIVTKDGKVLLTDTSDEKQAEILSGWSDMLAVVRSSYESMYYYGVKQDGTIIDSIVNKGNASLNEFKNLEWVRSVVYDNTENIIGYTKDGKVLAYGTASRLWELIATITGDAYNLAQTMMYDSEYEREEAWYKDSEIYEYVCEEAGKLKYYSDEAYSLGCILLQEDGTAAFYSDGLQNTVFYSDVKQIAEGCDFMIVKNDGTVEIVDNGFAGSADEYAREYATYSYVEEWKDIEQVFCFGNNALGFKTDGTIYGLEFWQEMSVMKKRYAKQGIVLGITEDDRAHVVSCGTEQEENGMLQAEGWTNVADIAIGDSHIVGLLHDGTVVAAGRNDAGQCDVEEWTDIVSIVAGKRCTLGINADGDLVVAGTLVY